MASNNIAALTTKRVVDSTLDPTQAADFWIKVEEETIAVHKDLLISAAPYFHCLFESGMQEVLNQTITVDCYRPIIVKTVIKYIYGESTNFEWEDITDYIDIVESWQMLELKEKLDEYICENIDCNNCIPCYFMAHAYILSKVTTEATRQLCKYFSSVTAGPEFLQIEFAKLLELLCVDTMRNMSCEAKLKACINWVQADEITRKCHYMDLLEHIGLKCCSENFVRVVIQAYKNQNDAGGDIVKRYIDPLHTLVSQDVVDKGKSVIAVCNVEDQDQCTMKAVEINPPNISTDEVHSVLNDLRNSQSRCWTPYGVFIYSSWLHRSWLRRNTAAALLDFKSMSYVHLPYLPFPVDDGHAVYNEDKVYFLFRRKHINAPPDNMYSMHALDLRTLQWACCGFLPQTSPNLAPSVCVKCAVGSRIYVITSHNTFFVYDTVHDKWECLEEPAVRTDFTSCAVVVDLDMYILNGRDKQCAKYNTTTGQWTRIKGHRVRYASCDAMCISGKIILCGSFQPYCDISPYITHVVLYNIASNEWETSSLKFLWKSSKICMHGSRMLFC